MIYNTVVRHALTTSKFRVRRFIYILFCHYSQDDLSTRKPKFHPSERYIEDRNAFTLPLVRYIGRTTSTLALSFLFDWTQVIRHPLGSVTALVAYPLASSIMIAVSLGFRTFSHIDSGELGKKLGG